MKQIIKIVLITFLIFGNTVYAEEKLTTKEKQQLHKLIKKHVDSLYEEEVEIQRLTKTIIVGIDFKDLEEKVEKKRFEQFGKALGIVVRVSGVKVLGMCKHVQKSQEKRFSEVFFYVSDNWFHSLKQDKLLQDYFFKDLPHDKREKSLNRLEKEKNSTYISKNYYYHNYRPESGGCVVISNNFNDEEFFLPNMLFRLYKCFISSQTEGISDVKYTMFNKDEQYGTSYISVIDKALLRTLYSEEITEYLGKKKTFEKAKAKLTELTVKALIKHNYGKKILKANGYE